MLPFPQEIIFSRSSQVWGYARGANPPEPNPNGQRSRSNVSNFCLGNSRLALTSVHPFDLFVTRFHGIRHAHRTDRDNPRPEERGLRAYQVLLQFSSLRPLRPQDVSLPTNALAGSGIPYMGSVREEQKREFRFLQVPHHLLCRR